MTDHVSRKMAERLKGVWEGETECVLVRNSDGIWKKSYLCTGYKRDYILPCPSLGELGRNLLWEDVEKYWFNVGHHRADAFDFWLFNKFAFDADSVAEVWLWAQKGEA